MSPASRRRVKKKPQKKRKKTNPKRGIDYQHAVGSVAQRLDPSAKVEVGKWVDGPDGRRDLDVIVRPSAPALPIVIDREVECVLTSVRSRCLKMATSFWCWGTRRRRFGSPSSLSRERGQSFNSHCGLALERQWRATAAHRMPWSAGHGRPSNVPPCSQHRDAFRRSA